MQEDQEEALAKLCGDSETIGDRKYHQTTHPYVASAVRAVRAVTGTLTAGTLMVFNAVTSELNY